jgi:lysophospholipase L1-like esterase
MAVPTLWTIIVVLQPGPGRYLFFQRQLLPDYAQRSHYHEQDAQAGCMRSCIVFLGDSITEFWDLRTSFPHRAFVNRGIRGQTTGQMLLRFQQDVVDLNPSVVVINGGVNDLNTGLGPNDLKAIEENYKSIAELSLANKIRPVFATVLPINPGVRHLGQLTKPDKNSAIKTLDDWLRAYCIQEHLDLVDYAPLVSDENGSLRSDFSSDGLHPNAKGYAIMATALEKLALDNSSERP